MDKLDKQKSKDKENEDFKWELVRDIVSSYLSRSNKGLLKDKAQQENYHDTKK